MPENTPSTQESEVSEHALMQQWLENQRSEIQLKSERLALSTKELDHNRALSEKTIDAQLKDRSQERDWLKSVIQYSFIFLGAVIVALLIFGAFVIAKGKEAFLSEVIALFIELGKYLIGALTGFFFAKARYNAAKPPKEGEDPQ